MLNIHFEITLTPKLPVRKSDSDSFVGHKQLNKLC